MAMIFIMRTRQIDRLPAKAICRKMSQRIEAADRGAIETCREPMGAN
jgi:hypothetical protein